MRLRALNALVFAFVALAARAGSLVPLPPAEAAKHMTLPPGFTAMLFAGEPDVVQPITFCFDDRGRLWVVESMSYPNWVADPKLGHDRIVIFEDRKGDGHFSKRTVFADNLANVSGIEIGFGGVWLCSTPNFIFIPVRDGEDKPAGEPQVLLDGWSLKAKHNVFNRLIWGPDGWLYGCNGILAPSRVGKPGTPDDQRVTVSCGVWRYHPTKHAFEIVMNGSTNPWGLDFDDYGQGFITNCVIEHLFHVIPGAHYKRMAGQAGEPSPYTYDLMTSCADHIHWGGGDWTSSRGGLGAHSDAGGGHAHAGAMVYLGDNWPDSYRNSIFMCNIHGNRVNHDLLEQHGSGYVAHHGKDFLLANDPWFRGLNLAYGPDGAVYLTDWTDTGECHNYDRVDQTNGRVFKITYGPPTAQPDMNVAGMSDEQLVQLQLHKNDWYVRHARRVLQERASNGKLSGGTADALKKMLAENTDVTRKLRALWALHAIGADDEATLVGLLASPEVYVRGWAIQLLAEPGKPSDAAVVKFAEIAKSDKSPTVRLFLASASQRLQPAQAWPVVEALLAHAEDATDQDLPLMGWYAMQPLTIADPARAAAMLPNVQFPIVRQNIARLLTTLDVKNVAILLDHATDTAAQLPVLHGIQLALGDRRSADAPPGWSQVGERLADSDNGEVRLRGAILSLTFGQAGAEAAVRRLVTDPSLATNERREALTALVQAKPAESAAFLQTLLTDQDLGDMAIRALATSGNPHTAQLLIERYAAFTPDNKRAAIATLSARADSAAAMLAAADAGKLPRGDLDALTVRQLTRLKDPTVDAGVKKLWGTLRPASQEKVELMAQYRAELAPAALAKANLSNGRAVFNKTCAQCHTLFDAGGNVGPNLTGSQRANLDYLLENVLDPSAVVAKEYQMTFVKTTDGRVITGIIAGETANAVTLKMPGETVTVPTNEIRVRKTEEVSMMPEGLLQALSPEDRRDLVGYLASPAQVPLADAK